MQTPKAKPGSLEAPQRKSPATTTARRLKTSGLDTSPNKPSRTPKSSPKVLDRRSPRSPMSEKKCPSRAASEMESQVGSARREAEEAKSELRAVSEKLAESEKQLAELAETEDDRIRELRELSQERDKAWESELEAVRRQHSMDSTAAAAELQRLRSHLERAAESEESAHGLARRLREELGECRESEARAASEAEQWKARVKSLEGLVGKLQAEVINVSGGDGEEVRELRVELGSVKSEVSRLRSALDAAEVRYQEEFIRSTLQMRSAYEEAERARGRAEELEARVVEEERSKAEIARADVEAEESGRRAAEEELRRVKVQSDQWRKAAEAAASILSTENGFGSPFSPDYLDDDSPKKRNGNVLKKIGVLLKKAHK